MIQVIIVDDEPLIRDGLRRLIDWGKFGMEVGPHSPTEPWPWNISPESMWIWQSWTSRCRLWTASA